MSSISLIFPKKQDLVNKKGSMRVVRMGTDNNKLNYFNQKYYKQYEPVIGILLDNAWIVL